MSQNQQEQSEAKLLAFIEGELDDAGRAEIEKHLEAHPQHRKLLEEMRGMRDWVRWLPKETAPAELAEAFQGRLERSMLLDPDESAGRPMRINRWPQIRAAAAIVFLTLGLGAVLYIALPRNNPLANVQPATQPNRAVALGIKTDESIPDGTAGGRRQPLTREAEEKLADGGPAGPAELDPASSPASRPADALAMARPTDETPAKPIEAAHLSADAPAAGNTPTTERALAEVKFKMRDPTEQLDQIARNTYGMVSDDPILAGLLSKSEGLSKQWLNGGPPPPTTSPLDGAVKEGVLANRARHPYVMVVLAADTDRARKQIGDYLADNGISTQVVDDTYRLRERETVAAKSLSDAAAAAAPGRAPLAAAPAPVFRAAVAAPSSPAMAATPPAPASRPLAPVQKQQSIARSMLAPAPAAAPPPPAPTPSPGNGLGQLRDSAAALPDPGHPNASVADGDILIARRMTERQAHELQAHLRQPQSFQWAAVYTEAIGSASPTPLGDMPTHGAPAVSPPKDLAKNIIPSTQSFAYGGASSDKGRTAFKDALAAGEPPELKRLPTERQGHPGSTFQPRTPVKYRGQCPAEQRRPSKPVQPKGAPAPAAPVAAPTPAIAAAGGAGGGGGLGRQDQLDRGVLLKRRELPTTGPASQPTTQPISSLRSTFGDEPPVDVVIVLQQSPTTQPASR